MNTIVVWLVSMGSFHTQAGQPKPAMPIPIPIPTGSDSRFHYGLFTDWHSPKCRRPIWRTETRIGDEPVWDVAVVGREGARMRTKVKVAEDYRIWATTVPRTVGDGGVGPGCELEIYVWNNWTAGLDIEFTESGPRIVIAFTHFPDEGYIRRYGWSLFTNEIVTACGWFLDKDFMDAYIFGAYFILVTELEQCLNYFGFSARE